ncbi:MAG: chemotaxis response regulator protein-glutamate methylesterase [Anaerolineae bacterium]|nr:chemotaxis response regulator protein-glutamate methylesterase [Anaerolineae bacterium]MCA9896140.1 chemotaxis response regulator protein-glutamate methylesterase [Anaerolineae bacterium]
MQQSNDVTRVLVADDSPTQRQYLTSLINEVPDLTVVGHASDGAQAIDMVKTLHPDVISMDIKMPKTDGLEATRYIMSQTPTPVVIVSSLLDDDVELAIKALDSGALAVLSKPVNRNHIDFKKRQHELVTTLRAMAKVKVVSRRSKFSTQGLSTVKTLRATPEIIAIGASTGGPRALHHVLMNLPSSLPVPIVVVQHMPPEFIPGLARWLDHVTPLDVKVAEQGDTLKSGHVFIAPGDQHLIVEKHDLNLVARLSDASYAQDYKPSVNVLFNSVASACGAAAVGIVMTGMGDDGALGLLAMKEKGAYTLTQDEHSSTVYGMPSAAIKCNAAENCVSLSDLPNEIMKVL